MKTVTLWLWVVNTTTRNLLLHGSPHPHDINEPSSVTASPTSSLGKQKRAVTELLNDPAYPFDQCIPNSLKKRHVLWALLWHIIIWESLVSHNIITSAWLLPSAFLFPTLLSSGKLSSSHRSFQHSKSHLRRWLRVTQFVLYTGVLAKVLNLTFQESAPKSKNSAYLLLHLRPLDPASSTSNLEGITLTTAHTC